MLKSILEAQDLSKVSVEIPEWGLTKDQAFIRTMTGLERDAFEASNVERGPGGQMQVTFKNMSARLVARCLVDAEGKRIIPDDQIDALGQKSAKVLLRLFRVAQQVNGLDAGAVKEAEKN
jgi:hypothetical protein